MKKKLMAVIGGLALVVCSAYAQPGLLDPTFNAGSGANGLVTSMALQPDGKIILGGLFNTFNDVPRRRIARLNPGGTLDLRFDPGLGIEGTVSNVFVLNDGKIMIFGSLVKGTNLSHVVRLNTDGSLDLGFNASYDYRDQMLALQSDGKPIKAFVDAIIQAGLGYSIHRLEHDGDRDLNFAGPSVSALGGTTGVLTVTGAVQPDDTILMGGDLFERLHPWGTLDTGFVGYDSRNRGVWTFAFQNDGKILVSGTFTNFGGSGRARLARLNFDGTPDMTFNPGSGPDTPPNALACLPDGKVLIAGNFTNFNGAPCPRIARLAPDGTLDRTLDPGLGPNARVSALSVTSDGRILIGGEFTNVNGAVCNRIALLNGDPPTAPTFSAFPTNVTAMAGRRLVLSPAVAGSQPMQFQWLLNGTNIAGATNLSLSLPNMQLGQVGVYALQATNPQGWATSTGALLSVERASAFPGSPDMGAFLNADADSVIRAMAVRTNGKVVIGGQFSRVNGVSRGRVAQLNGDGTIDFDFDPGAGPDNTVYALAVQSDGKVLVGGSFANINGTFRNRLARLNANGTLDPTFNPGLTFHPSTEPAVYALAVQPDDKIVVGGNFYYSSGFGTYGALSRLKSDGGRDSTFNAGFSTSVTIYCLLLQDDGRIVAGGSQSPYEGVSDPVLRRFSTNGISDPGFNPSGGGTVRVLARQPDGKVLAATAYGIARFGAQGVSDTNFSSRSFPGIAALATQPDGRILVGGSFTSANGIPRKHVCKLNLDGTVDTTFDTSACADGTVYCLAALPNGKVLIGGGFDTVNGCKRGGLALLNGDFRILSFGQTGNYFRASVQTDLGKNYRLEFSDSLPGGPWTALLEVTGDGTMQDLLGPMPEGPQRFYRVRVE